ncbi:GNAT family N-acetyltransferase [Deinococcus aquiradiocola]|uniref:GNAT family N-acetyltransferase n=1 Tax=Deinococcus aquiradiocola TaxID=393059 RepID=A0A917PRY8_9DEIO|nr:GNAT family N-acetyltransferase [Deinococcus aquiradiocola]GGJ89397.1 GNAT family N-acetyltransferase [Deinococcus aquiradiocola]
MNAGPDSGITVRDAAPPDAPQLARLLTLAYLHQWTYTAERVTARLHAPTTERFTLTAEQAGQVVAGLDADPFPTAPGSLRVQLYGEPAAFTPLYLQALARAGRAGTRRLLSVVREDHRPQVAFLTAAGWRNAYQSWGAQLDLTAFTFTPFRPLEERHYLAGTEVHRFAADDRAAPWDALHALYRQGLQDAPRNPTTTHDADTPAYFREMVAGGQVFAALHGTQVRSYTALTVDGRGVASEHTATRPQDRSRGLATLVKATALDWAAREGFRTAGTGGTVANLPMLRVNARLGYRTEAMWLTWVRTVPPGVTSRA